MKNIIKNISSLSKKLGIYKPLRFIYNFIFLFNKKSEITFSGTTAKFITPTFRIREDIESLMGEKDILKLLLQGLRSDDVFWDIGASYGIYSLLASKKLDTGKIYAFEPEPQTFKLLKKNIALNKAQNIIPLQIALGDKEGIFNLHTSDSPNIGTHSFAFRNDYPVRKKGKPMLVRKGDDVVSSGEVCLPNVVKIDVEGSEFNVLKGMKEVLSIPKLRFIQIEIHPNVLPLFNQTVDEVLKIMESEGFKVTVNYQRGTEYEVVFEKDI